MFKAFAYKNPKFMLCFKSIIKRIVIRIQILKKYLHSSLSVQKISQNSLRAFQKLAFDIKKILKVK